MLRRSGGRENSVELRASRPPLTQAETSARDLLRCADLAMYEAKRAGRNTYRVHAAAQPRNRGSQHRAA
jgi:predicted signal transduction protein with EAL and GGDEF domain